MRRLLSLSAVVGCLCLTVPTWTQDVPEEKVRVLCDETDPENECPGPLCLCVPDTLEIVFDNGSQSILEYETFPGPLSIDVTVIMDTRSDFVQGWSYGVSHDPGVLTLENVTVEGTDADPGDAAFLFDGTSMDDIQTCGPDPGCDPASRTDGGGWVTAAAYFREAFHLPVKRNTIAHAHYVLTRDVGEDGTLLRFTSRLAKRGGLPTSIVLIVNGQSRLWTTAVDGWIKKRAPESAFFIRGDANADLDVDISDPIFTLMYLFLPDTEPPPCLKAADADGDGDIDITDAIYGLDVQWFGGEPIPEPYPACGLDPTDDDLSCDSFPVCG